MEVLHLFDIRSCFCMTDTPLTADWLQVCFGTRPDSFSEAFLKKIHTPPLKVLTHYDSTPISQHSFSHHPLFDSLCVSTSVFPPSYLFQYAVTQVEDCIVGLLRVPLLLLQSEMLFISVDAIHGGHFEIHFDDVRVPASNNLLGEEWGFEIAQGQLGPGRLHHCMRAVGLAEWVLELLCQCTVHRQPFGKRLYKHEVVAHWTAECRITISQSRLLTLHAAHTLDKQGNKAGRKHIAMIKVAAVRMASKVVDCAMGVQESDGPDEVHLSTIALLELRDQRRRAQAKL
uniref:Acyl-CoA dehydrogenase/oxidase C-terminal domain-containing protein n=1 Tax=Sinocyclocheilus grahami TaxID=75366 RepID=A0A672KY60_SINGR